MLELILFAIFLFNVYRRLKQHSENSSGLAFEG